MRITAFNGGLNTRLAPHLIGVNEAVIFENVKNEKGHFTPIDRKVDVTDIYSPGRTPLKYGFWYERDGIPFYSDTPADWVVYNDELYFSDRVGRPKRYVNGAFVNLGIQGPTGSFTVATAGAATTDVRRYAVTFYNNATGGESQPLFSDEVTVGEDGVTISNIPTSGDPQVTHVRIYRIGGFLTSYNYVASVVNGTSSYVDTFADDQVGPGLLESTDWSPAPAGLKYLTEYCGMLFGAIGDKVYFTPIGKFDAWPALYYFDAPQQVFGIAKTTVGLLIFTINRTIIVTGNGPDSFTQHELSDDQGCISHDSVSNVKGVAVWVSRDGICASDGSSVEVISKNKLGKVSLDVVNAVTFDEQYLLQLTDGTTLAWDFAYGNIAKKLNYDVFSLVRGGAFLFGLKDNRVWRLSNNPKDPLVAKYKSGWLTEGNMIQSKLQDMIQVAYKGSITISFWVEERLVLTKTLHSDTVKVEKFKTPQDSTRNCFVQFMIEGTGDVYEIEIGQAIANV